MQEPKRLTVYAGALAPEAFVLEIRWDDAPVDLRTVTAASLLVRVPDGFEQTWTATIAAGPIPPAPSRCSIALLHPYAAGDVSLPGRYVAVARLTVPAGVVRADPAEFEVLPQFQARHVR